MRGFLLIFWAFLALASLGGLGYRLVATQFAEPTPLRHALENGAVDRAVDGLERPDFTPTPEVLLNSGILLAGFCLAGYAAWRIVVLTAKPVPQRKRKGSARRRPLSP